MTQSPPAKGTYLCFDYGQKRIGIAVGETLAGTSNPLYAVNNHLGTPEWSRIDALVEQWLPVGLVVGVPLTVDAGEQTMTGLSRGFMKRLRKRYSLPVFAADERFSSMAAQSEIATLRARGQRNRRTSKADVDTLAAALILEAWFESNDPN